MQGKIGLERLWAGCDTLLLVAVFILLCVVWRSNHRQAKLFGAAAAEKSEVSPKPPQRLLSVERVAERMRVSLDRGRVNAIARSMVETDWEAMPPFPAMDMREDGKVCEVFFTLPAGIAEENVRVTAAGGVLTLTLKDDASGKLIMQRIRIPCGLESAGKILTVISNDVLNVRICPAGG
jgi:HSP20 family molecular chaperone IbpA